MPHTIRLRTPWQLEIRAVTQGAVVAGIMLEKMTVPGDWQNQLGPDFAGEVCYRRRFQRPTGLPNSDRVELVCGGILPSGVVSLNGTRLGEIRGLSTAGRWPIQMLLQPSNRLEITIEVNLTEVAPSNGLVGEVYLEIHD